MKVAIYGGNAKFISLLKSFADTALFDDLESALVYSKKEVGALFILPKYDRGEYSVPEFSEDTASKLFEIVKQGKTKIYIENYPAYDYRDCFVLGLQARGLMNNIGKYTICLSGSYNETQGFEILQKRNGFYFPSAIHTDCKTKILAEIKNCIGTHSVISEGEREGVILLKTDRGVYCSMADLTNLEDYGIFSYSHWKSFYKKLLSEITGADAEAVEKAFISEYKKIEIRKTDRSKDRDKALCDAVRSAVNWHEKSGIMLDGGRGGVYEMFRSFDLNPAKNLRADSSLFTAALFMAAGKYFGNESYEEIARNLAELMLMKRNIQIKEGNNKGVFKWFSGNSDMGTRSVYVSDSSRVGNSVYALYKLTGEELYKETVLDYGEALLKWFGGQALLPACNFNYEKDDLYSIQANRRITCPEFYDAPLIFLSNIYSLTKDDRYKEQIKKTAEHLASIYPNYEAIASHSENFTYSRLLGALSVAQRFGDGAWTPIINELLVYFKNRRHKSGGFCEGKAYFDENSLKKDMEFAVGLGVDDAIADMVYCQNTLAYTLNILLSASGSFNRDLAQELFDSLTEFLLDTQISCSDRRFDGAWMRAFDMDNTEYYGCDKDFAWGPYCILTGWVTGAIPLVFLDILGLKTMY